MELFYDVITVIENNNNKSPDDMSPLPGGSPITFIVSLYSPRVFIYIPTCRCAKSVRVCTRKRHVLFDRATFGSPNDLFCPRVNLLCTTCTNILVKPYPVKYNRNCYSLHRCTWIFASPYRFWRRVVSYILR